MKYPIKVDNDFRGPIPIIKLNNVFREVYGVFFVTNDIDPLLPMRREMEVQSLTLSLS